MGWVSGLVLESLAFGQAFSLSCGVGWVFVLPVGLELLAFGFQVTVSGLGFWFRVLGLGFWVLGLGSRV